MRIEQACNDTFLDHGPHLSKAAHRLHESSKSLLYAIIQWLGLINHVSKGLICAGFGTSREISIPPISLGGLVLPRQDVVCARGCGKLVTGRANGKCSLLFLFNFRN